MRQLLMAQVCGEAGKGPRGNVFGLGAPTIGDSTAAAHSVVRSSQCKFFPPLHHLPPTHHILPLWSRAIIFKHMLTWRGLLVRHPNTRAPLSSIAHPAP
jgi:hypothetical protein